MLMRRIAPSAMKAAHRRDLVEAGPILVLEHDARGVFLDDAADDAGREHDPAGVRVVLDDERHIAPDRVGGVAVVGGELVVGLHARGRRDHDAGGACLHDVLGQCRHRGETGRRNPHQNGKVRTQGHLTCQRHRFRVRELRRLAHDAEHGDAGDPAADVEVDQPVEAGAIDCPVVGKRRRSDDIDASGIGIEQLRRHSGPPIRLCSLHCYRGRQDFDQQTPFSRRLS
jgi:hypothetical protein